MKINYRHQELARRAEHPRATYDRLRKQAPPSAPRFANVAERMLPDIHEQRQWLRMAGYSLKWLSLVGPTRPVGWTKPEPPPTPAEP